MEEISFSPDFNLARWLLDANVEAGRGDKVALRCHDEAWTYSALVEGSNRFGNALRTLGLCQEDRVLMVVPDRPEFVITWFGLLKVGGVFAMVNPHLPSDDYGHYLNYTRAKVLVVDKEALTRIEPHLPHARWLKAVVVVGAGDTPLGSGGAPRHYFEELLLRHSPILEYAPTTPDDVAGWLFTSGSTGKPKAAVHLHQDFAFNIENYAKRVLGIREDDITLGVPKLFFGYATGTNLMFPFAVGGCSVIFPERSTADTLFDLIERFRPTLLTSVPTMINTMEQHPLAESADLSCLRMVLSAGEALPPELYFRWVRRFGVEILDGIGSAEMFHIYISNYPGAVKPGSLGRLVPGYSARVVNADGQEVKTGEVGRLNIIGRSAAVMYWGDRAKSVATFQGDTCVTGDLFRQDVDGYFWYEGRADDMLKVGGIWVSPLEVENCLLSHEVVAEVAVVGAEEEGGLIKPHAFVVVKEGVEATTQLKEVLISYTRSQLAYYKYPRWVDFVPQLPKNDRGKVDRKVIRTWTQTP